MGNFFEDLLDPLDLAGDFSGANAADSAERAATAQANATVSAAEIQREGLRETLDLQRESRDLARSDQQPFAQAGVNQLAEIQNLLTPQGQADFIQDNPFFDILAQDAERRLFNNQAAKGKLGSGGTAEALRNSILLLGNDLVGQDIQRRGGIASLGQAAASGQAASAQNFGNQAGAAQQGTARSIADLTLQGANAQAAGLVGSSNARAQGAQNIAQLGATLFL